MSRSPALVPRLNMLLLLLALGLLAFAVARTYSLEKRLKAVEAAERGAGPEELSGGQ
jgi:Tfp pilus assembly protein PilX